MDSPAERRPVAAFQIPNGGKTVVVCDDGSVRAGNLPAGTWSEMEPIPSTAAAAQRNKEPDAGNRGAPKFHPMPRGGPEW